MKIFTLVLVLNVEYGKAFCGSLFYRLVNVVLGAENVMRGPFLVSCRYQSWNYKPQNCQNGIIQSAFMIDHIHYIVAPHPPLINFYWIKEIYRSIYFKKHDRSSFKNFLSRVFRIDGPNANTSDPSKNFPSRHVLRLFMLVYAIPFKIQ